jgi:hypothetical protein
MFRPLTVVSIAAFCLVGWHVYRAEEAATLLDREMRDIGRKTEAARERTQVLRAEWAMLNEPERLRQVAQKHLSLEAMTPAQFIRLPDLQRRLPNAVAFAGPVSLFGSAPATALASSAAGTEHDLPTGLQGTPAAARGPALVAAAQAAVPAVVAVAAAAPRPTAPVAAAPHPAPAQPVAQAAAPAPHAAPRMQVAIAAPPPIPARAAPEPVRERAAPEPVRAEPSRTEPARPPVALTARVAPPRRRITAAPPAEAVETAARAPERAAPERGNLAERSNLAERGNLPDRSLGGRNPLVADARPMARGDSLLRTAAHVPAPQPVAAPMPSGSALGYIGGGRLAPPVPLARPVPIEANGWSR